jgi:hypothetical protein
MKSTIGNKRNSWREGDALEKELRFDSGITRSMLSGIKRHTIRLGKRKFASSITIHGRQAQVSWFKHTSLLHMDMKLLSNEFGFVSMFNALFTLQKFYPGITINDPITIVEYRLVVS